jgi:hypothetical protein
MTRYAIVGCGKQKLNLEGDKGPVAIARLYTSNYFELKREYAKECCDEYLILSAKHGLVFPDFHVEESYDQTIDDIDGGQLERWTTDVREDLWRFGELQPKDRLVLLAGQQYLEPLEPTLQELPNPIERPFDDTDGIGEQISESLSQQMQTGQTPGPTGGGVESTDLGSQIDEMAEDIGVEVED